MNNDIPSENQELDWIQLRKDLDLESKETGTEKLIRKFKETPLVPIGALATTACLVCGLWALRTGQSKMSQTMMRGRVLAQGFTIIALITGLGYTVVDK